MSKLVWGIVGVVAAGAVIGGWIGYGRFAVEGGRAPWAVINEEHDVLAEEIAKGAGAAELSKALRLAANREDPKAVQMLLAAGVSPNPETKGHCMVEQAARWGRAKMAGQLLEGGADPALCSVERSEIAKDIVVYGHGDVPEADLVWALSGLVPEDAPSDPAVWAVALDEAKKRKLSSVVAFLEDPTADVAARPTSDADLPQGKPGSLDLDDLKTVCGGTALADAAPYVKQDGQAAQVYYFERRSDEYRWPGRGPGMPELPKWWTSWDDPSHTQLVACVDVVEKQKARACRYEGDGGGVTTYGATFEFTVYEAKTGTKVASKRLDKKPPPTCPVVKSGTDQEGLYPTYSSELQAFLQPHVGGPA